MITYIIGFSDTMMYCYILTYWNYEDSMLLPIFSENNYSMEEFNQICQEAKEKSKKLNSLSYEDEYSIYGLYHTLIDEYSFKSLDDKVLSFNINDEKTSLLKDDSELKILLNLKTF